jgi:23S rRNA pseudouridine1911/1915/1917 synthase
MNPKYVVEEEMELLDAITQIHPGSSMRTLRHMLTQKRVTVDDMMKQQARLVVKKGASIEIHSKPQQEIKKMQGIIYEDREIIVVTKPAGVLTVATDKMERDTLHSRVQNYLQRSDADAWGYIVHRLDKDTSGIIIFAKSEESKKHLQDQFSERKVMRWYTAIVEGEPEEDEGTATHWLIEDKNLRVWVVEDGVKGAREAVTHWFVLERNGLTSKVELDIETGRRHQIRVQMAELGHPLVGDPKHGAQFDPRRLLLHATSLEFIHPNGKTMTLMSAIPPEFNRASQLEEEVGKND